jgi:hypothetical protein
VSWNDVFWTRLGGEKPSLRFDMYFRKRDDLHLPVELVAGEPRVPVDDALLAQLNRVDQSALFARLKGDHERKMWTTNANNLRAAAGKTVSLYTAVVAIIVPLGAIKRQTLQLNVYTGLTFKVDALRAAVDPDIRAKLSSLKKPFATAYDIAPLLGIESPRDTPDDDGTDTDDALAEGPDTGPSATTVAWDQHYNLIFFGPPGTGKSFQLQQIVSSHLGATDDRVYRVTFHPEYSYFDFVGTYKPRVGWMKSLNDFTDADRRSHTNREPRVYYAFDPGPFSRALRQALRSPTEAVVVVVEEINRGNCAAIFGDVFQLLDRIGDDVSPEVRGRSEYPIVPSAEWKAWLDEQLEGVNSPCWADGRLRLPGNLYLYATMNTSDQSLFPMDTAFRRRWGLQYVGVETTTTVRTRVRLHAGDREGVAWVDFAKVLNEAIVEHTRSDDKQMGPWFVQRAPNDTYVADVQFRSKVLFYLWSEVFRDAPQKVFHPAVRTYDQLVRRHGDGQSVFLDAISGRLQPQGA